MPRLITVADPVPIFKGIVGAHQPGVDLCLQFPLQRYHLGIVPRRPTDEVVSLEGILLVVEQAPGTLPGNGISMVPRHHPAKRRAMDDLHVHGKIDPYTVRDA